MKVQIYWNSQRKCYTVRSAVTKYVLAYVDAFRMADVTFKIYEKQRQRVLRDKQKNVHAFICGQLTDIVLAGKIRKIDIRHVLPGVAVHPSFERMTREDTVCYNSHNYRYNPYAQDTFRAMRDVYLAGQVDFKVSGADYLRGSIFIDFKVSGADYLRGSIFNGKPQMIGRNPCLITD